MYFSHSHQHQTFEAKLIPAALKYLHFNCQSPVQF